MGQHGFRDTMSAASLIACHLNAPYGKIVSAGDVVASLRSGYFAALSEEANGILEALFTEVPPDLILKCANQVGAPLERVAHLYELALELGVMRSPEWEAFTSWVRRTKE